MMQLAEQIIEKRVADFISSALAAAPAIKHRAICAWHEAKEGADPDAAPAPGGLAVYINAAPRAYQSFTSSIATVSVAVGLVFPWESFPSRRGIADATARVAALFEKWNRLHESVQTDLTVEGLFRCDGIRLAGGRRADNSDERATAVSMTLEIIGVLTDFTPTHPVNPV